MLLNKTNEVRSKIYFHLVQFTGIFHYIHSLTRSLSPPTLSFSLCFSACHYVLFCLSVSISLSHSLSLSLSLYIYIYFK